VLARTLVKDPADLHAAQKIHRSYSSGRLSDYPKGRIKAKVAANAEAFNIFAPIDLSTATVGIYKEINELITEYPPLAADAAYAKTVRPVGVDVAAYKAPSSSLASTLQAAIAPAYTAALDELILDSATVVNGWSVVLGVGDITHNPIKRAAFVIDGPGFQVEKEALYYSMGRLDGNALTGSNTYTLTFRRASCLG